MKKIINNPADVVSESLNGMQQAYPEFWSILRMRK